MCELGFNLRNQTAERSTGGVAAKSSWQRAGRHSTRGAPTMAGVREKLLTASDLATLCEVDLKTIHNWVDRGRISHFRTPGRHLRFRAADVADFLRAWGYSVPRELARASSRTLLVLGTKETVALVTRALGEGAAASPAPPGQAGPAPAPPRMAAAPAGEQAAAK